MIQIAICDNNPDYAQKVRHMLERFLNELGVSFDFHLFCSGEELCADILRAKEFDIIFLDACMKQMSGIEAAVILRKAKCNAQIAFYAVTDELSREGYTVQARRYILKNELERYLPECVTAMLKDMNLESRRVSYLGFNVEKILHTKDISYVIGKGKLIYVHFYDTKRKECHYHEELNKVEADLSLFGFLRIHQNFLVNVRHVKKMTNYKAIMINKEVLPIPRVKYQKVKKAYLMMTSSIERQERRRNEQEMRL
ncbi:MAG: LytTR family DNA-binding domain-containing protein [Lachnospiraceae bacterium]|jgi:DNA-binding LytR/AlgR family response regulator|nr:LytTR family DNA-binding domain-containing protein [Lachnospiraceae bacterium]